RPRWKRIEFKPDVGSNRAAAATFLQMFSCPSDTLFRTFPVDLTAITVAQANYTAVNGGHWETSAHPGDNNGTFLRNSHFKFADITDGLSNTLFAGERNSKHANVTWVGAANGGAVPAWQSSDPYGDAEGPQALV